jgi:hypothetical protein
MKESIKRARHAERQLARTRPPSPTTICASASSPSASSPAMQAVVILLLDVSGSMGERERQISKTFFFWAIQGCAASTAT